jgi:activator of HSP90 ATPase
MILKTATIRQKVLIPATPDEVYEALADPKKHSEFTISKATGKAVVGGKFTAWDGYIFGKFLKLSAGKRIVQEWSTTEWPEGYPPSIVEFQMAKKGDGTMLAMIHSKVPAGQAESYRQGWKDFYWKPLKEHFGNLRQK